jgi:hypothetical protein
MSKQQPAEMEKTKVPHTGINAPIYDTDVVAVATLAMQMLPPIDLPLNWQTTEPVKLSRELKRRSKWWCSGDEDAEQASEQDDELPFTKQLEWARHFDDLPEPGDQYPTPFELVAQIAIDRARALLNEAKGTIRPLRKEWETITINEIKKGMAALHTYNDWIRHFHAIAGEGKYVWLNQALSYILPRSKDQNRLLYFREYYRHRTSRLIESTARGTVGRMSVIYPDEASQEKIRESKNLPPTCHVIRTIPNLTTTCFNHQQFATLMPEFVAFLASHGPSVRKKWSRAQGRKGGLKSASLRTGADSSGHTLKFKVPENKALSVAALKHSKSNRVVRKRKRS